jgi:hypothetical protein
MNIDFNSFFRIRVDITQVPDKPLYQLVIERIDLEEGFTTSKEIVFFEKEQLKQFVDYINEATHGIV